MALSALNKEGQRFKSCLSLWNRRLRTATLEAEECPDGNTTRALANNWERFDAMTPFGVRWLQREADKFGAGIMLPEFIKKYGNDGFVSKIADSIKAHDSNSPGPLISNAEGWHQKPHLARCARAT